MFTFACILRQFPIEFYSTFFFPRRFFSFHSRKLQDGKIFFHHLKINVFCFSFIFFRCYLLQHPNSVNIKSISREHKLMMALARTSYKRCDIVRLTQAPIVTVDRLRTWCCACFFLREILVVGCAKYFLIKFYYIWTKYTAFVASLALYLRPRYAWSDVVVIFFCAVMRVACSRRIARNEKNENVHFFWWYWQNRKYISCKDCNHLFYLLEAEIDVEQRPWCHDKAKYMSFGKYLVG